MTDFNKIIYKIRSGELILWVGSGFSSLAGYPTGSQLANIIKEKLNPSEKQYFENKYNLDEVAEEFVLIRSREELISLLSEVFKEAPKNLMYHKMVSEIPQIQTIITTNYDKSFEHTYGNDIFPVISDKDFPAIPRNKVSLVTAQSIVNGAPMSAARIPSKTGKPFFFPVEMYALILQKACAPIAFLKVPDIFCCSFIILISLSA